MRIPVFFKLCRLEGISFDLSTQVIVCDCRRICEASAVPSPQIYIGCEAHGTAACTGNVFGDVSKNFG